MRHSHNKTIAINVRLKPSDSSAHPRAANYTHVAMAQGIAYVDFWLHRASIACRDREDGQGWPTERRGGASRHSCRDGR